MFDIFKADVERYFASIGSHSTRERLAAVFEMSLWAIGIFRFAKWSHSLRFALIRWPLMAFYFFLYKISQAISGIRISMDSEIGAGLVIHNFGGVIIHGRIGKNCVFVQGSQMISAGDGKARGYPTLGDNVYVGAGAKILGNVVIGNHCRIGANAVVVTDVPDGAVVLPPHCHIIRSGIRPNRPTYLEPVAVFQANGDGAGSSAATKTVDLATSALRTRILQLLEETVCRGQKLTVNDSASLLENGIVDSLGILVLAEGISERFGFVVEQDEIMPENLDSVEALVGYLRRKGVQD